MSGLSREQFIDLAYYLGSEKVVDKGRDNIQLCCPVHQESNPSMGFSIEKQVVNCFSCHFRGSVSWLVLKSLPDTFKSLKEVDEFLKDRYGVDFAKSDRDLTKGIKRFDDFDEEPKEREIMPLFKLAPFKSGKETFQYFYDRGFTKETVKAFKIGRDLESKTVTIPVFWEDNQLAGVIGRYITKRPKNSRYKIYEFKKGQLTFPLNKLQVIDDTIILVEGILDAVWLHQLGFPNAQSILGNGISKDQADIIKSRCLKVIDMFDNDEGGVISRQIARQMLGKDIVYYTVTYPEGKKDPCDCTKEEIIEMLENKNSTLNKKIIRL